MPTLKAILTFAALLIICSATGAGMALVVGWASGITELQGTIYGSLMTASFMLTADPVGMIGKRSKTAE